MVTRLRLSLLVSAAILVGSPVSASQSQSGPGTDSAPEGDLVGRALESGAYEAALAILAVDVPRSTASSLLFVQTYAEAMGIRLGQGAEGAVMTLMMLPLRGQEESRTEAARRLADLWNSDDRPTLTELRLRLTWLAQIRDAGFGNLLEPGLGTELALRTLDAIDMQQQPVEYLAALELGMQQSPRNPIWESFQPDAVRFVEAAETLERQERYLDAAEIYRRLSYLDRDRADYYRRLLAYAQRSRVEHLEAVFGADVAFDAGTTLQKQHLNEDEQAAFRSYMNRLWTTAAEARPYARMPRTVSGTMRLEALPIAYTFTSDLHLGPEAVLTIGEGVRLRDGRIFLNGGRLILEGSASQPVRLTNVEIGTALPSAAGRGAPPMTSGVVTARYAVFNQCRVISGGPPLAIWEASATRSLGSQWHFPTDTAVRWDGSVFEGSTFAFLGGSEAAFRPAEYRGSSAAGLTGNRFIECSVDDLMVAISSGSQFLNCTLAWNSGRLHEASPESADLSDNIYVPAGGLPAQFHWNIRYAPESEIYRFDYLGIGEVRPDIGEASRDWR